MNNIKNKIFIVFLFFPFIAYSNSTIELARELKENYPDEITVLTNSSTVIEFEKKGDKMIGMENTNRKFIGLEKNRRFEYPVFYNSFVILDKISVENGVLSRPLQYTHDGIFKDDIMYRSGRFTIAKFGAEYELSSTLKFNDLKYLNRVYLNDAFPCVERELKIVIPNNVKVELIPMNFEGYSIEEKSWKEGSDQIFTYRVVNIKNKTNETNMPGSSHIYPHIIIKVISFNIKSKTTTIFKTTNDLYSWYATLVNEVLENPDTLNPLVESLIKGKESDYDKISAIYYWVQNKIRYIAFEEGIAGFKPASCQRVYKDMYGDCKGMANLTKHMLKIAGYDARLAWLGTRNLAYDYTLPSLVVDNHVICAVKYNDTFLFLDPTVKYLRLGDVYEGIQGKQALVENGDSFILKNIPTNNIADNLYKYLIEFQLDDNNNQISGSIRMELSGEAKINFISTLNTFNSDDKEFILKRYLSNFNKLIQISDVTMTEFDRNEKLVVTANLKLMNEISFIDGEYYLYPDPFQFYKGSKMEEDRIYDYWLNMKMKIEQTVMIKIPDNLQVSYLPKGFNSKNDSYSFESEIGIDSNILEYSINITLPKAEILVSEFPAWNNTITDLTNYYDNPIILKNK